MQTQIAFSSRLYNRINHTPLPPFSTSCPSLEKLDVVVDVQFFPTCDMLVCSIMWDRFPIFWWSTDNQELISTEL